VVWWDVCNSIPPGLALLILPAPAFARLRKSARGPPAALQERKRPCKIFADLDDHQSLHPDPVSGAPAFAEARRLAGRRRRRQQRCPGRPARDGRLPPPVLPKATRCPIFRPGRAPVFSVEVDLHVRHRRGGPRAPVRLAIGPQVAQQIHHRGGTQRFCAGRAAARTPRESCCS